MIVAEKVSQQAQTEEIDTMKAFNFPRGIAGFPDAHQFGFIYEGKGNMLCMQSLDLPEASFILTTWDTERLGEPPKLTAEQRLCLKSPKSTELLWMLVLNPFADKEWVTANLRAPIAINENSQTGLQCILNSPELELRYPWIKQPV